MNWLKIIIAAIFEVGWAVGLTHASTTLEWLLTIIAIIVSFYLLINASQYLPYAVFVVLGTTGVTILDFVVFGQPVIIGKIVLIFALLAGVIGLKLVTPSEGGKK